MESLSFETEDLVPEVYLSLGLNTPEDDTPETPSVLYVISSLLLRAVQRNEKLLEAMKKKESATIFHGLRAPSLGLKRYTERIFKYAKCSPSCFVLAHIYIDRYLQQPNVHLTSLNVHRLLITSVMVAAKFIDDAFFNNAYYARVGGINTTELNKMELDFLFSLDFRLQVSTGTFVRYCLQLKKEAVAGGYQIEWPIRTCGLKDRSEKEEPKSQLAMQRFSCGTV